MKGNNSKKLVWKHKSISKNYYITMIIGFSPCIILLHVIITRLLLDYKGFDDIIIVIIVTPLTLALPLYFLYKLGKSFFILRVKGSNFFIKPKLLAFTKKFNLSEIKSIEFLLTRTRLNYRPAIFGSDSNSLSIHITINIIDSLGVVHVFNVIRVYLYPTTIDTPFLDKMNAIKSRFINDLEDLKRLFPSLVSIRDEIQEEYEFEIFR